MKPAHHLILALVLFVVAQLMASFVIAEIKPGAQHRADQAYHAELPPGEIAGTLMLGGFRGIAIDFLWLRAIRAKNDARYYESVALYELISRVQPRFERVWEYMAWEMAYNIGHYVDQDADKWSWFLAGARANVHGIEVNPQSERLLRHAAWLFFHKGENYMDLIEQQDWLPMLSKMATAYAQDVSLPQQGKNLSNYALAEYFYRLSVHVDIAENAQQPAFVRRMICIAMDRDGNRLRNRGQHYQALHRYLDAMVEWQTVLAWANDESRPGRWRSFDPGMALDSFDRNEGSLRRKSANIALRLAKDEKIGKAFSAAVLARDIELCRTMLADRSAWREHISAASIQWLDE
ncbi:MAG: hypothetical protein HRU15_13555 [Planctomycetes bacterium]|nr:hypothetical protein [Planctomycetota bacterium]